MSHVARGLASRQRRQVITSRDPLRQLSQLHSPQHITQLRLPDQDDLQKLLRRRLQVGEQAHLLEYFRAQVLRFVHDDHYAPPLCMCAEQVSIQCIYQRLDAGSLARRHADTQLFADGEHEFCGRDARIENQGDFSVLRNLAEEATDDRGLAGANLASQLDEAAGLVDAIEKMSERLGVPLAQEQVTRVRRDGERLFAETKKCRIHRYLARGQPLPWPPSCTWRAAE